MYQPASTLSTEMLGYFSLFHSTICSGVEPYLGPRTLKSPAGAGGTVTYTSGVTGGTGDGAGTPLGRLRTSPAQMSLKSPGLGCPACGFTPSSAFRLTP